MFMFANGDSGGDGGEGGVEDEDVRRGVGGGQDLRVTAAAAGGTVVAMKARLSAFQASLLLADVCCSSSRWQSCN